VVGAGPAGAAAALALARAGRSVVLLERGPFPGSKNVYGGVVYGRILDGIIPQWWEQVPVQRWVVRRSTMIMTPGRALSVDYQDSSWGTAPYNGMTVYRSDFDSWLAAHAVDAGAELVTETVATGLLRDRGGAVTGVRTDRPDGELRAKVVIACDGVNSFLAKEAGLYRHQQAEHFTLGVKEVLALPKEEIDRRFNVSGLDGVDIEILGATGSIPGGGFLYTNLDTVSVGVVLQLPGLAEAGVRPEEVIARLKRQPAIAPLVDGGDLKEYSAHLIPEGGYDTLPELAADGLMIAGDAASLTLAAGLWLEGVNFAIASGAAAGETALEALRRGDTSAAGLAGYRQRLESTFVLADHKKLRRAPGLVLGSRTQHEYPQLLCNLAEEMFTVSNPLPKGGLLQAARRQLRHSGVRITDLIKDGLDGWRSFG
jgi:electron transfer flavoprotein-quinone oxidoreductase